MTRIALVTGGVSGIGAATCKVLQAAGCKVAANYFGNGDVAAAFKKETGIPIYEWDVADFDACQQGVAAVVKDLGPVDILVNNAGITQDGMLHKMSKEQWRSVIDVDLGGCFNMCRAVVEPMRERRFGRIINVSSINALAGQFGQTNYAAAKAGMIGFTKALALEGAARGITVNAVAPGYTDTAMVAAVRPDILEKIVATVPAGSANRRKSPRQSPSWRVTKPPSSPARPCQSMAANICASGDPIHRLLRRSIFRGVFASCLSYHRAASAARLPSASSQYPAEAI